MNNNRNRISPKRRRRARVFAAQALYQQNYNHLSLSELQKQYMQSNINCKTDWELFQQLITGTSENQTQLIEVMETFLDRPASTANPLDRAILLLGTYEIRHCLEIPHKVIINEYIEISKLLSTEESAKFINGVLDKVAKKLRSELTGFPPTPE